MLEDNDYGKKNSNVIKWCKYCKSELKRKEYESSRDFKRRQFCDKNCFSRYRKEEHAKRIIDKQYNMLFADYYIWDSDNILIHCKCNCGNEKYYKMYRFKCDIPYSCGCSVNIKHGMVNTKLYKSWALMKRRCDNPDDLHKKYYKDKGITYCEEWKSFIPFKEWALNNGYVDGYTIERLDNSLSYCPENCTWIPMSEQAKNKTNKTHLIINGIDKSYTEWSRECGLNESTIRARVNRGLTGVDVIKPVKKKGEYNATVPQVSH